jgi:hypothetical protein
MQINAFVAPASPVTDQTVLFAILRMKRVGDGNLLFQLVHDGGSALPLLILANVVTFAPLAIKSG